jgi:hypothetical protein
MKTVSRAEIVQRFNSGFHVHGMHLAWDIGLGEYRLWELPKGQRIAIAELEEFARKNGALRSDEQMAN